MSGVTLNDLFLVAFSGQLRNHERLGREARRYARTLSMRFASRLPEDLHEEIFDEAFAQLWTMPGRLSGDQQPLALFRKAVLLAIRAVRVSYAPPGTRTRVNRDASPSRIAAEDVGRIPDAAQLAACTAGEGSASWIDLDQLPSPDSLRIEEMLNQRSEVIAILHHSPPIVAAALSGIYLEDQPTGRVAQALGVCRFAMHRQITGFAHTWRAAA